MQVLILITEDPLRSTGETHETGFRHPWSRENNPITEQLRARIATGEGSTTAGMREALAQAHSAFEQEIIQSMVALIAHEENPALRAALIVEQHAWEAFQTASSVLLIRTYAFKQGTVYPLTADSRCLDLVRDRAIELHNRIFKAEGTL